MRSGALAQWAIFVYWQTNGRAYPTAFTIFRFGELLLSVALSIDRPAGVSSPITGRADSWSRVTAGTSRL
jgi:hypothetical protein